MILVALNTLLRIEVEYIDVNIINKIQSNIYKSINIK